MVLLGKVLSSLNLKSYQDYKYVVFKYTCLFFFLITIILFVLNVLVKGYISWDLFSIIVIIFWLAFLCYYSKWNRNISSILFSITCFLIAIIILGLWGFANPYGIILLIFVLNLTVLINDINVSFVINFIFFIVFIALGILQITNIIVYDSSWLSNPLNFSDLIFVTLFLGLIMIITWINISALYTRYLENIQLTKELEDYNRKLQIDVIKKTKEIIQVNSELAESNKILNLAYEQLGKADKNRFIRMNMLAHYGSVIYAIVHNMANPMMVIMHYIKEANFENIETKIKIKKSINMLSEMIETARGSLRVNDDVEIFYPRDVINSVCNMFFNKARRFHINMLWDCKLLEDGYCVLGAKSKFVQIILNLIDNAIDATKESDIRNIKINCVRKGNYGVFRILDSGIGINKNEADKIFQLFFTKKKNGNGVGLYISKQFAVKNFDGDIKLIKSTKGTLFEFRFKLKKC